MRPMVYSAVHRTDTATPALRRIVELAVATCDFVYRGAGVGTNAVAPRSRSSRLRRHGF